MNSDSSSLLETTLPDDDMAGGVINGAEVFDRDSKHSLTSEESRSLVQGFQRLEKSSKTTDFKIKSGNESWSVHSSVLILQSNVLAKMCASGLKEGQEHCLELVDEESDVIDSFVDYLYKFKYKSEGASLCHHLKVAILADKYEMEMLRDFARASFCNALHTQKKYIEDLVQAVEYVYEFPTVLAAERDMIIDNAVNNRLLAHEFRGLMRKVPELNIDIVDAIAKKLESTQGKSHLGWRNEHRFICPDCTETFVAHIPIENRYWRETSSDGWGSGVSVDIAGKQYGCFWCKKELDSKGWHATRGF